MVTLQSGDGRQFVESQARQRQTEAKKRKTHFGIPDESTFSSLENDGKRVVAVQWVRNEISKVARSL